MLEQFSTKNVMNAWGMERLRTRNELFQSKPNTPSPTHNMVKLLPLVRWFKTSEILISSTKSVLVKPISLQPYDVNLWYFKHKLFYLIAFIVWNIKGLRHWVATILKLENPSLWPKLNSFIKEIKKIKLK